MKDIELSKESGRNLEIGAKKSSRILDISKTKIISHVASQMLLGRKFLEAPENQGSTTKETDPIKILKKRSEISDELRRSLASRPDDADILGAEYDLEMFRVLTQREYRQITRYDTWEKDLKPEEWIEKCKNSGKETHGLSPMFNGESYVWEPVIVEGYDYEAQRYQVTVILTGQVKLVTRLALRFDFEDNNEFYDRLRVCKERKDRVETELRFQELCDSVRDEDVASITTEILEDVFKKMEIPEDKFEFGHVKETRGRLTNVVTSIYRLAMKKCYILDSSLDLTMLKRIEEINIPSRINGIAIPYFGRLFVKREHRKTLTMTLEPDSEIICRSKNLTKIDNTLKKGSINVKKHYHCK